MSAVRARIAGLMAVAMVTWLSPCAALGQTEPTKPAAAPAASRKPVRRPVIDLEQKAREVRQGQIVPGAPAPKAEVTPQPPPLPQPPAPSKAQQAPDASVLGLPPAPGAAPRADAARPEASPPAKDALDQPPVRDDTSPLRDPVGNVPLVVGGTVKARVVLVEGRSGEAQWRGAVTSAWQTAEADQQQTGRIEVRTGPGVAVLLRVEDKVALRVEHLTRLRLQRLVRPDGTVELGVVLERGSLQVTPIDTDELGLAKMPVMVVTPDKTVPVRKAVVVGYSAFNGTTERPVSKQAPSP